MAWIPGRAGDDGGCEAETTGGNENVVIPVTTGIQGPWIPGRSRG